jgi:AmiR/NasT family two-component response regulator
LRSPAAAAQTSGGFRRATKNRGSARAVGGKDSASPHAESGAPPGIRGGAVVSRGPGWPSARRISAGLSRRFACACSSLTKRRRAWRRTPAIARALGHDVVARELAAEGAARSIREETPELAIVVLHTDEEHALELIAEIVEEGICPVIVQSNDGDPEFAARAAECGVFAVTAPVEADALQTSIEVAVRRFEEFEDLTAQVENLEGALRRRAIVERAKGILMDRRGIDERAAFELLRDRARSSKRTLVDVAQSVLDELPPLPGRDA